MSRGAVRSTGLEPYSSRDLVDYYVSLGGVFDRQSGSHQFFRLPNGKTVGAAVGAGDKVATSLARLVAKELQMSYGELREALGHPIIKAGKPSKGKVKSQPVGVGRSDVAAELAAISKAARDLEHQIRKGAPRDQSHYKAMFPHVVAARTELRKIRP